MKNSTVYCVMNVCSCFVMGWKVRIFQSVMNTGGCSRLVWQEAALPMCYIVRKTTTRSVPLSHAGYLRTLWSLGAL
jgi:hypothetical protein